MFRLMIIKAVFMDKKKIWEQYKRDMKGPEFRRIAIRRTSQ